MSRSAIHPGKVLADELDAHGISITEFARQIDVPPNRISQIIHGKRAITGDTALRFAHWFGTHAEFWLNLQAAHDLRQAERVAGPAIRRLPTRARPASSAPLTRTKAAS